MAFVKAVKMIESIPVASGVYRITCTANKRFYIGSALNLHRRRDEHFSNLRQNKHCNPILQNAWTKYGSQSFTFEVLELVLPMSLTAREQYWFNKLKPFGRKGFNIAREAGSNLGIKRSPETGAKISALRMGMKFSAEHVANMSKVRMGHPAYNKGKSVTEEQKKAVSQAQSKLTPEQVYEIRRLLSEGQLSQAAIGRKFGLCPATITKIKQGYKYFWEREN